MRVKIKSREASELLRNLKPSQRRRFVEKSVIRYSRTKEGRKLLAGMKKYGGGEGGGEAVEKG